MALTGFALDASFGCSTHELLTVAVRYGDTTEVLKDLRKGALGDILELFAEVIHRELKLRRHSIESDKGVEVDECLYS